MAYGLSVTGDIRVIEDGAERSLRERPPTRPWVWILVGLAIGVGFAVVIATPSSTDPIPEAVEDTVVDLDPVAPKDTPVGVADVVPGFPDALVAVTRTGRQNLAHLLWPIAGDSVIRPLPVGAFGEAEFDVTGTWLAISTRVPDTGDTFLSMGKPSSLRPLASDVRGFAWHDSQSGLLAYTQVTDDGWQLSISNAGREPYVVASDSENLGAVAAWGDWGWAIQSLEAESESITLLTTAGGIKSVVEGTVLDSSPFGSILMVDDQVRILSAGGGLRSIHVEPAALGGVFAGAISPDGTSAALLGSLGLNVISIAGAVPELTVPFTTAINKVSWSSDSRFVIIPFLSGVIVVNVESGESWEELKAHTVIESAVIPLNR